MTNKQTIAQSLKIKDFPFVIKDKNGNVIYYENSNGCWIKREFDSNGNKIYCENSDGYWYKYEFDSNGNVIYCENSNGDIIDKRPKIIELTLEDITKLKGVDASLIRIKE